MTDPRADQLITNGIHRFLADGVHYRDLMDIRAAIGQWSDWCRVWAEFADAGEARGNAALEAGCTATAADEFVRASLYYHYAQNFFYEDLALKRRMQDRKIAIFKRAAALWEPPCERVDIPFEGTAIPGYFRLPRNGTEPPCVILMGGLDTTKEDYTNVNNLCIQRGLATFAFDGPGQGEMAWSMRWRPDFERAIYTVIDYLETRPEIDARRIGLIGRSLGGHYAPKAAAGDKRVRAAVAWGVLYQPIPLTGRPKSVQDGYMFCTGAPSPEAAEQMFMRSITLEGVASNITCPLLIVHGGLDPFPIAQATRLAKEARGVVETLMWDDSIHCCHDRSHIVRPGMADFMKRHL